LKKMFVVGDKNKTKFFLVLIEYVMVILLAGFFLSQIETDGLIEWALLVFVLFFLTSYLTIRFILKESVKDYFFDLKYSTKGFVLGIIGLMIFVAVMWVFVVQFNWESDVSVSGWILGNTGMMVFFDIVLVPLVVFSKEFFFRGFLLKISSAVMGVVLAIIFQAVLATYFEIYIGYYLNYRQVILLLIPNIFLGYLAYVNRSMIVSAIFSWIYILALDLIFAYKLSQ